MHQFTASPLLPEAPVSRPVARRSSPIALERRDFVRGVHTRVQITIAPDGSIAMRASFAGAHRIGVVGIGFTLLALDGSGEPIWSVGSRRIRVAGRWDRRAPSHCEAHSDARMPHGILERMRYAAIVTRTDDDGVDGLRFAAREAAIFVGPPRDARV